MSATEIKFLGHASVLLSHDTIKLVIDPNFSAKLPGIPRREAPVFEPLEMREVDAVLYTNARFHRFDHHSLKFFKQRRARVHGPAGVTRFVRRFYNFPVYPVENGVAFGVGPFRITPIESPHWVFRFFAWHPSSFHYLIEAPDRTLLYVSDTRYDPEFFKRVGLNREVDAAILPIDHVVHDFVAQNRFLDGKGALSAFADLNAGLMLPNAYGAFSANGRDAGAARDRLEKELQNIPVPREKLRWLAPGEALAN